MLSMFFQNKKIIEQSINITFFKNKYYVQASSMTTEGVWIDNEDKIHVFDIIDETTIDRLLKIFGESQIGIEHPKKWSTKTKLQELLNFRTINDLMKHSKNISISKKDCFEISPWIYSAKEKALLGSKSLHLKVELDSTKLLEAIKEGFKRCEQ